MRIEILGTGCPKCQALAANAETAAKNLGVDFELCKVTDLSEIMKRGVMMTPALTIDGEVKVVGKIADEAELAAILTSVLAQEGGTK